MASVWRLGGLTWREFARRVGAEFTRDNVLGRRSRLLGSLRTAPSNAGRKSGRAGAGYPSHRRAHTRGFFYAQLHPTARPGLFSRPTSANCPLFFTPKFAQLAPPVTRPASRPLAQDERLSPGTTRTAPGRNQPGASSREV